ncbi:hypothetical protein LJK88_01785 [Paenibacillus sp. P26]|nr:hypothetical protein LJK88_01785 [Paenibacillus sp. P26]
MRTEPPNRVTLIDDTFSSNPNASKAALDVLASLGRKHTVAVIGYMKDLGKYAVKGHKDVGRHAARRRVTRLFTVGELGRHIAAGAREAGLPAKRIRSFLSRRGLHPALKAAIRPDTAILVKGTHLLKLEKTVAFLKKNVR